MAVFDAVGSVVASWWFGMLAAAALVAATYFMRAESSAEKREQLKRERKTKRQETTQDVDEFLNSVLAGKIPEPQPAATASVKAAKPASMSAPPAIGSRSESVGAADAAAPPESKPKEPLLRWTQSPDEVEIFVTVPKEAQRSDVKFAVTGTKIDLKLKGQIVLQGNLWLPVDKDGCNWQIEDNGDARVVWVQLAKIDTSSRTPWPQLLKT